MCVPNTAEYIGEWAGGYSAAFDKVNHLGIIYNLCSVGIGGPVLSILTQFISNRSHHVMVEGCQSKLVYVVSGVRKQCCRSVIVPSVHFESFLYSVKYSDRLCL